MEHYNNSYDILILLIVIVISIVWVLLLLCGFFHLAIHYSLKGGIREFYNLDKTYYQKIDDNV
jgi:hypothetical protein